MAERFILSSLIALVGLLGAFVFFYPGQRDDVNTVVGADTAATQLKISEIEIEQAKFQDGYAQIKDGVVVDGKAFTVPVPKGIDVVPYESTRGHGYQIIVQEVWGRRGIGYGPDAGDYTRAVSCADGYELRADELECILYVASSTP